MTEHYQLQQVNEATGEMVTSLRETRQTIVDSVMTIQDSSLRFTQSLFSGWMELLTQQTESMQHLQQQWGQQVRKQQDAFQTLMSASMSIYMDFLRAPFAFSQQLVDTAEAGLERKREIAH